MKNQTWQSKQDERRAICAEMIHDAGFQFRVLDPKHNYHWRIDELGMDLWPTAMKYRKLTSQGKASSMSFEQFAQLLKHTPDSNWLFSLVNTATGEVKNIYSPEDLNDVLNIDWTVL